MDVIPGYFLVVLGKQVMRRVDNAVSIAEVQTHWQEWNEEKIIRGTAGSMFTI